MKKVALLIGISDYGEGFQPLSKAINDIRAMRRVLEDSLKGEFHDVTQLPNPDAQTMRNAIEDFFAELDKDTLALLYFSGHGWKDDLNRLSLAARGSYKTTKGVPAKRTLVAAREIKYFMDECASERQVIILDCCYSGAFDGAKDDGQVNISEHLGGSGRVILASSASDSKSFEDSETDLSLYTRFLVEGMETGAADQNRDDWISADELHAYVKKHIQEIKPNMNPELHPLREGYNIRIVRSIPDDPNVRYRREVEQRADHLDISEFARAVLDRLRHTLQLTRDQASALEEEVFRPRREHDENFAHYKRLYTKALLKSNPLPPRTMDDFRRLQELSELSKEEVAEIEKEAKTVAAKAAKVNKRVRELIAAAAAHIARKDYDQAIAKCLDAQKIDSGYAEIYVQWGRAHYYKSEFDIAIKNYTRALEIDPGRADVHACLGAAFYDIKNDDQSIAACSEAIKIDAHFTEAFALRGLTYYRQNKLDAAIADFECVIKLDPADARPYYNLGLCYRNKRSSVQDRSNNAQAVKNFTRYIELSPEDPDGYEKRGKIHLDQNDYEASVADATEVLRRKPDCVAALAYRAIAYDRLKRPDLAAQDKANRRKLSQES